MEQHRIGILGLGIMGQRMLAGMAEHPRFAPLAAWDPAPAACRAALARSPGLCIAQDPAALLGDPRLTAIYIACPPAQHCAYASAALAGGKAVYCEKPLGVDLAQSRALVALAQRSGLPDLVNFSLASVPAARELERRLAGGELGTPVGFDIRLRFSRWPRAWQQGAASWLSRRAQGGLAREVLSHWIFLAGRLLGRLELQAAAVRYPPGEELAETHLLAQLVSVRDVPVSIAASSGGAGPDQIECTLWGERQSCRISDWSRLWTSEDGADWRELPAAVPPGSQPQLDNAAAALAGERHSMPDFAEGLAVQEQIEGILARGV